MAEIIFRKLAKKDIPFVKSLLSAIWEIERFTNDEKTADAVISSILYSDLARQDYSEIACIDGSPAGVVLAKISPESKPDFFWHRKYAAYAKSLHSSNLDVQAVQEYLKVENSFQRLLSDSAGSSELIFFMISEESRGKGIGKELMSHYFSECRRRGVDTMHLVTDTQCDYQYYDNAGFRRLKEESFELNFKSGQAMHRTFLYTLDISEQQ